jgi:hypothetical protein
MIIYQRVATFTGPPEEVMPWAVEITGAVNERTTLNASLWQGLSGGQLGTLGWSSVVENLTAVEAAFAKLAGDRGYLDLVAKAQDWVPVPGEDHILRMVHTAGGDYVRPDVGAYAEGTSAVPAGGKLAKAGEFGVKISDRHSKLTHSSVLFCTAEYGAYGEMRWLGLYESAAEVDHAAELIAKDEGYMKAIDGAADLFVEGLSRRTLARRIA